MSLYTSKKKQNVLLTSCPDDKLLNAIGIRQGLTVKVVTRHPLGGPIVVRVNQRDIAIDKHLATAITAKVVT